MAVLVSLTGWLISNFQIADLSIITASVIAIVFICYMGYAIHKRIAHKISSLEEL